MFASHHDRGFIGWNNSSGGIHVRNKMFGLALSIAQDTFVRRWPKRANEDSGDSVMRIEDFAGTAFAYSVVHLHVRNE